MRTSEWIQIGFAIVLAAAAWIQPFFGRPLPVRRRWNITLLALVPLVAVMLARATASFPSPALCFHPARLAYRSSLPGALLADRAILPGSEPPHRAAAADLRPLVDAADGRHLRYLPHRVGPGAGSRLPLLLSAGAAWPACDVRGRPTQPRRELLAGGPDRDLSLLRDHAVCAGISAARPCGQPGGPGANRQGARSSIAGFSSMAASMPSRSPARTWLLRLRSSLVLLRFAPLLGVVFLFVSIWIALGAVVGRYHYALDVLLGAVTALGGLPGLLPLPYLTPKIFIAAPATIFCAGLCGLPSAEAERLRSTRGCRPEAAAAHLALPEGKNGSGLRVAGCA